MTYEVTLGDRVLEVQVRKQGDQWFIRLDGAPEQAVDITRPKPQLMSMLLDGQSYSVGLAPRDDGWDVDLLGSNHPCAVVDPRRKALRLTDGAAQGSLSSSMPGKVVRILVDLGATVTKGQPVAVVEAMKMENEIKAPLDGVVAEILVTPGQAVNAGATLMRIE